MGSAMTNEERDLITRFVERVGGAAGGGQPLPAIDPEADRLIADLFSRYPEARYRITQMAFLQEHALVEAQNRISRLQWELQQRQAQAPAGSPWGAGAAQPQPRGGFLSGLFGGGQSAPPPPPPPRYAPPQYAPPPPQYPPGYNPGLFQSQGPGFFGSALRTAAGVAGGVLAADALMNLFSPHQAFAGGLGTAPQVTEAVPASFANPWGGDPGDAGGAAKDPVETDKFSGPPQVDQSAWTPALDQGGGWQDASDQGGWQDASDQGGWDQASDDGGGDWGGGDDSQNS
jgi:hypothetical protein